MDHRRSTKRWDHQSGRARYRPASRHRPARAGQSDRLHLVSCWHHPHGLENPKALASWPSIAGALLQRPDHVWFSSSHRTPRWSKGDSNSPSHPERQRSEGRYMGPAHRSLGVAPSREAPSFCGGLRHGTGRGDTFVLSGRSNAHTPIALSSLPACGDFDIEKTRPEWRDEVQNGRACKAIAAQMAAREVRQLFLVRPGRRGRMSARYAIAGDSDLVRSHLIGLSDVDGTRLESGSSSRK